MVITKAYICVSAYKSIGVAKCMQETFQEIRSKMRVWAEQGLCIKYINLAVIFPELCGIGVFVSEAPNDLRNQLLYSLYFKKKGAGFLSIEKTLQMKEDKWF